MIFNRVFAMPNADTFSIKPIGEFVRKYLGGDSIDPFARNKAWCTWTNDLNPETSAQYHMDAEDFCKEMRRLGRTVSVALFDPPYSPRQIAECYRGFGREVTARDTQNAYLYRRVRDALDPLIAPGGVCLSFGWNSVGMGRRRGYQPIELLLVTHGGAHNDTICLAETKVAPQVA